MKKARDSGPGLLPSSGKEKPAAAEAGRACLGQQESAGAVDAEVLLAAVEVQVLFGDGDGLADGRGGEDR